MPNMRISDDTTVLNQYLYCSTKSNKPRIHHRVCEERCRKVKRCHYYKEWHSQNYVEEAEKKEVKPGKKKVIRQARKKAKKKKLKAKAVKA